MNEKLTKKQLKDLKNYINYQLKILSLRSNGDRNLILSIPKTEHFNASRDDVESVLNEIYGSQIPEIISVQEFTCIETNSTVLYTLKFKK